MQISDQSGGSFRNTAIVFILIAISVLFVRSFYTVEPEMHDARKKWIVASELAETNDPALIVSWDHHSSRWGVVIPAYLAVKVGGQNLITYLGLVLSLFAVTFSTLIICGKRDAGPGLLYAFGVLLFFEPMFFRASTQLQPFMFGVFYLTVSLWLLCRYLSTANVVLLALSALFAFFAYGAKELYLFFIPGLLLLLFLRSGFKACFYYCVWLFAFLFVEILIFNSLVDGLTYGRIEFLRSGKHVSKMTGGTNVASSSRFLIEYYNSLPYPQKGFEFLFGRWHRLPLFNQILVFLSTIYVVLLVLKGKITRMGDFSLGIIFLTYSYSILLSVTPLSISPLIPLQPLWEKYLTPVMPFFMYIGFLMCWQIVTVQKMFPRGKAVWCINGLALVFVVYALVLDSPWTYKYKQQDYPVKQAMLWQYEKLNHALEDGSGICAGATLNLINAKVLLKLYMNEDGILERLVLEKDRNNGLRVLHLNNFPYEEIENFIPYNDYNKRISKQACIDTFANQ